MTHAFFAYVSTEEQRKVAAEARRATMLMLRTLEHRSSGAEFKREAIIPGEIIGWRAWVVRSNGYIQSLTRYTIWSPNKTVEGNIEGKVGVFAFKTRELALESFSKGPFLIGTVKLWGDIIEHELGYRAQFAKVNSFDFVGKDNDNHLGYLEITRKPDLAALRKLYGVE